MERMTERYEENGVRLKDADKYAPFVADVLAYHRLAAYEDTSLEPEEIIELKARMEGLEE